jgi:fumarate reductase subunit C
VKTYRRPVSGLWWTRNPFYLWYMARELSSVLIVIYALVLLTGLLRLFQGKNQFEAWQASLGSPVALAFHAITLVFVIYHAWTWFKVMPKTLPRIAIPDTLVVAGACAASVVLSLVFFVAVWWFGLWTV